jgi:hypothetical protein
MDRTPAEILVEEAVKQIRMRPGLADIVLDSQKFLDLLLPLKDTRRAGNYPLVKTDWNRQDYEREKVNQHFFVELRGLVLNDLVTYEEKPEIGWVEKSRRGVVSFNYNRFHRSYDTTWEYDILVRTNQRVAEILSAAAGRGEKYSLMFRLDIKDWARKGSATDIRLPILTCPKLTNDEIGVIIAAEKKRRELRGYSDYGR